MSCVNKVMLMGNLTRDPDLKYTPQGLAVLEFSLALNNTYTKKDGTKVDEVSYIDCFKFGEGAEKVANFLKKGRQVHVEGRIKQERWETPDGDKRSRIRVAADRLTFVGGAGKKDEAADAPPPDDMSMSDVQV